MIYTKLFEHRITMYFRNAKKKINAPKTQNWLPEALVTMALFYGTIFLRKYVHQIP